MILAIDVGIRNMSFCLLETRDGLEPLATGNFGDVSLRSSIVSWDVVDVTEGRGVKNINKEPLCSLADDIVEFVEVYRDIFERAEHIVIETQPSSKMRTLSFVLYGCIRAQFKSPVISFQGGGAKLAWPGTEPARTYSGRKRKAVELVKSAVSSGAICDGHGSVFLKSRKKDDLADSYLHALHFMKKMCRTRSPP